MLRSSQLPLLRPTDRTRLEPPIPTRARQLCDEIRAASAPPLDGESICTPALREDVRDQRGLRVRRMAVGQQVRPLRPGPQFTTGLYRSLFRTHQLSYQAVASALCEKAGRGAAARDVRSKRCLAKIPVHNLAGRIESGSMRALGDGATLRIDAALIKFQQLVTQVVVSGQESSFG
jgi:hypothetical protein